MLGNMPKSAATTSHQSNMPGPLGHPRTAEAPHKMTSRPTQPDRHHHVQTSGAPGKNHFRQHPSRNLKQPPTTAQAHEAAATATDTTHQPATYDPPTSTVGQKACDRVDL